MWFLMHKRYDIYVQNGKLHITVLTSIFGSFVEDKVRWRVMKPMGMFRLYQLIDNFYDLFIM